MSISREMTYIATDLIWVDRESRQRRIIDIGALIPSVRARGILHPLTIKKDFELVTGERRWETAKFLSLAEVPVRFYEELSLLEHQIIEFEENFKRTDLDWQDRVKAVNKIHELYMASNLDWTVEKTSEQIGLDSTMIYRYRMIAESILDGDQSIIKADSIPAAYTMLTRRRGRASDALHATVLDSINEVENGDGEDLPEPSGDGDVYYDGDNIIAGISGEDQTAPVVVRRVPQFRIECAELSEQLSSWKGERFNFLHCDLPYGVTLNGQANQEAFEGGGYDSDPDIYWALCRQLCAHWDKFMSPSAHVMFWISMKFYTDTVQFFQDNGPIDLKINPTPLIWHKTDGKGIISDALRGPRNIYEACLLMSTGDRKIVKPVSNVYGAPTSKSDAIHTNEKPQPMLEHFLSMLVDQHTRILDPTCGSGSAIRCAEKLGAEFGLGLEHNPEFATRAQDRLEQERTLRNLSASLT